jgi:histidine triad (HIT) family protein
LETVSLGSHQGNAHVHWHVAPLPPDVPYERQQFHAVMAENGILEVTPEQQAALAARIRPALQAQMKVSALHWSGHERSADPDEPVMIDTGTSIRSSH